MAHPQNKLPGVQIARAVAALSIAYLHSYIVTTPFPPGTAYPIPLSSKFPSVELFFAISGFVICLIAGKPNFKPLQFLFRRVFRLYPLWISTSLVYLVLCRFLLGYPGHHSPMFFAYSLTLLPTEGYPFYDLGWSLQHEFAFYILAALLVPNLGLLGLSAFLCAGIVLDHVFTLPWYLHQYAALYPNFLAGIAAFAANRYLKPLGFLIPFAVGLALLIFVGGGTVSPPALFLVLVGFVNIRLNKASIGVLLGDVSFSIYLIHPLVFGIVYSQLQPPLPPVWTQEFLRFGSIAVACVLAVASWKLFESPMIRAGNWLISRVDKPSPTSISFDPQAGA